VFHFNKKHLEDPTIPMWVVKAHGVTFYVNHVTAEIPWSTKETPDNPSTKGSLKFKKCKLSIDDDNNATLSKLGLLDRNLPTPYKPYTRIITSNGGAFHRALLAGEFNHSKIKEIHGGCGSSFIVCDLIEEAEATFASLKYAQQFRILNANEGYYKDYDKAKDWISEEYDIDYEFDD
jgi:hypothetical protein